MTRLLIEIFTTSLIVFLFYSCGFHSENEISGSLNSFGSSNQSLQMVATLENGQLSTCLYKVYEANKRPDYFRYNEVTPVTKKAFDYENFSNIIATRRDYSENMMMKFWELYQPI